MKWGHEKISNGGTKNSKMTLVGVCKWHVNRLHKKTKNTAERVRTYGEKMDWMSLNQKLADKLPTQFYAAIILLLSLVIDRGTKDFLERLSLHFGAL